MTDLPRPPRLERLYRQYLDDEKSADFIRSVGETYSLATLHRLAQAGERISRRAAILAVTFLGRKESLEVIGQALKDPDRAVRVLASDGIRTVWIQAGGQENASVLHAAMRHLAAGCWEDSLQLLDDLVKAAPEYCEAWNQRAIALFESGQIYEAIANCQQVLELNPYHFPAATGLGQCYLDLENSTMAIEHFQYALSICPDLEYVRHQINQLQRSLDS